MVDVELTEKTYYDTKRVFESLTGYKIFLKEGSPSLNIRNGVLHLHGVLDDDWGNYALFEHQLAHALFRTSTRYLSELSSYWSSRLASANDAVAPIAKRLAKSVALAIECVRVQSYWGMLYPVSNVTFSKKVGGMGGRGIGSLMLKAYYTPDSFASSVASAGWSITDDDREEVVRSLKLVERRPIESVALAMERIMPIIIKSLRPSQPGTSRATDDPSGKGTSANPSQQPSGVGGQDNVSSNIPTPNDTLNVLSMPPNLMNVTPTNLLNLIDDTRESIDTDTSEVNPQITKHFDQSQLQLTLDQLDDIGSRELSDIVYKLSNVEPPSLEDKLMFRVEPLRFMSTGRYDYDHGLYVQLSSLFRRFKGNPVVKPSEGGVMVNVEGYVSRLSGHGGSEMFYEPALSGRLSIVLLLDLSGSMNDEYGGSTKLERVAMLSMTLVRVLRDIKSVNFQVYGFYGDDGALAISRLGYDELSRVGAEGYTPTYSAVEYVTAVMSRMGGRRVLIIITDGEPNGPHSSGSPKYYNYTAAAIRRARSIGIHVYTILTLTSSGPMFWVLKAFGPSGHYSIMDPNNMYKLVADMVTSTVIRHLRSG